MSDVSLEEFAKLQGVSLKKVMEESENAGFFVSNPDNITGQEQEKLIKIIFKGKKMTVNKNEPKKISLTKRNVSEMKVQRASGEKSTVSIVRKKKRTYVRKTEELVEEKKPEIKQDVKAIEPVDDFKEENINVATQLEPIVEQSEEKIEFNVVPEQKVYGPMPPDSTFGKDTKRKAKKTVIKKIEDKSTKKTKLDKEKKRKKKK